MGQLVALQHFGGQLNGRDAVVAAREVREALQTNPRLLCLLQNAVSTCVMTQKQAWSGFYLRSQAHEHGAVAAADIQDVDGFGLLGAVDFPQQVACPLHRCVQHFPSEPVATAGQLLSNPSSGSRCHAMVMCALDKLTHAL